MSDDLQKEIDTLAMEFEAANDEEDAAATARLDQRAAAIEEELTRRINEIENATPGGHSGGGRGSSAPSVPSGEVSGLQSAVAYAQGSAASAERAAAQDEAAIAALQAGGTTGTAISELQASMAQHQQNANHYRAAASELTRQMGVREAYDANPGAGTKQFVISE